MTRAVEANERLTAAVGVKEARVGLAEIHEHVALVTLVSVVTLTEVATVCVDARGVSDAFSKVTFIHVQLTG